MRPRALAAGAMAAVAGLFGGATVVIAQGVDAPPASVDFDRLDDYPTPPLAAPPGPAQTILAVPPPGDTPESGNPFIANGVAIGAGVATYNSSGTGPAAKNTAAEANTPPRYIDPDQFDDAELTPGVTITEAQALNVFARLETNLEAVGLSLRDVIQLRAFLAAAPGEKRLDFEGFNRAYRQYFANVDLRNGEPIDTPVGTEPSSPMVSNPVRPTRTVLEVANLPVEGWLVEIEVIARFPVTERTAIPAGPRGERGPRGPRGPRGWRGPPGGDR